MKLSDALRLGSMATPKATGIRHSGSGSTCALGAIEYAIGCKRDNHPNAEAYFHCLRSIVKHPISDNTDQLAFAIRLTERIW